MNVPTSGESTDLLLAPTNRKGENTFPPWGAEGGFLFLTHEKKHKTMEEQVSEPVSNTPRLDVMSDAELMSEMGKFFGGQRFIELCGWVIVGTLIAEFQTKGDVPSLRRGMEERGMTRSALYRALADIRRFAVEVEGRPYPSQDHQVTVKLIKKISVALVA
jgi:hypothetical protein